MYTFSCQYFDVRVPEELMENEVEGGDNFADSYPPIKFLLDNHNQQIKGGEDSEGIMLCCGKATRNSRGKGVTQSVAVTFILKHREYEAYDDCVIEYLS